MTTVSLEYSLSPKTFFRTLEDEDLDRIVQLSKGLKSGRETIKAQYPDVRCDVKTSISRASYTVYLLGDKEQVSGATAILFESAGVPSFVESGYKIVDPALEKYGKKTKRRFFGFLDGKHVVDVQK